MKAIVVASACSDGSDGAGRSQMARSDKSSELGGPYP